MYPELRRSAALDLLTNRVHETQLVQSGRAELVDEPAHVGERRPEIGARLDHQNVCRRLGLEVVSRGSQFEHHAGERRTEAVVQIATKSPPFLLTSRHKLRPSPLKVGCQPNRLRRHADLASKIFEQLAIGGRKPLSRRARSKQQFTDNLLLVDQWQAHQVGSRRTSRHGHRRLPILLEADRHVRQLQRFAYCLHNRRQHRVGSQGRLESLSEAREHGVRFVALAVRQVVYPALQPHSQWLKQDRHNTSGQ